MAPCDTSATALQVWAQRRGNETAALTAPLQRGLTQLTLPFPPFCAALQCSLSAAVAWPRLTPPADPGLRPWPPLRPGAHVVDIIDLPTAAAIVAQQGDASFGENEGLLIFQPAAPATALTATVTPPADAVEVGDSFDVAVSVQTCGSAGGCTDAPGDVLLYVFVVAAAWVAREAEAARGFTLGGGAGGTLGSAARPERDDGTANLNQASFLFTTDQLLTIEDEQRLSQVRTRSAPAAACVACRENAANVQHCAGCGAQHGTPRSKPLCSPRGLRGAARRAGSR